MRRVRDANPDRVQVNAQGELFRVWRHHAIFTDSPLPMLAAEADHRRHAIIEQVIADLKNGPLAHLPSGSFTANSAWLVLAAMAFNLLRAAGSLASTFHAKATTATIRSPADQHRRPSRHLRPAHHPAPARRLALGHSLAATVHRSDRPTGDGLTHPPLPGPTGDPVETPSRSADSRTLRELQPPLKINHRHVPGCPVDPGLTVRFRRARSDLAR